MFKCDTVPMSHVSFITAKGETCQKHPCTLFRYDCSLKASSVEYMSCYTTLDDFKYGQHYTVRFLLAFVLSWSARMTWAGFPTKSRRTLPCTKEDMTFGPSISRAAFQCLCTQGSVIKSSVITDESTADKLGSRQIYLVRKRTAL